MKCLTLKNPWADLVATGKKTIETRTWQTAYRGPLLIHTSKAGPGPNNGLVVAWAKLVECRKMVWADRPKAWCECRAGTWAWVLEDIRQLKAPFPVRGQLQLFEVEPTAEILLF